MRIYLFVQTGLLASGQALSCVGKYSQSRQLLLPNTGGILDITSRKIDNGFSIFLDVGKVDFSLVDAFVNAFAICIQRRDHNNSFYGYGGYKNVQRDSCI